MSQPFSGIPDPGFPPRSRRRFQPGVVQQALRRMLREVQRIGQDLWLRGKRKPRTVALTGGAVALTLVGAYALSASGAGRSLCPAAGEGSSSSPTGRKTAQFLLLLDPVSHAEAGSELEIHYDVCGLASGTAYRGRIQLSQQRAVKKGSANRKPLVVTFRDQVDGLAARRSQELNLGSTKPGAYTLELSVVDNQGRERKKVQKVLVKAE